MLRNRKIPSENKKDYEFQCYECEQICYKINTLIMHRHRDLKEKSDVKTEQMVYCDQCKYMCTKKDTLRAYFNRNHTELQERTFECDSCDYTCTKKDTLRMYTGVKHKGKLSNSDKFEFEFAIRFTCL